MSLFWLCERQVWYWENILRKHTNISKTCHLQTIIYCQMFISSLLLSAKKQTDNLAYLPNAAWPCLFVSMNLNMKKISFLNICDKNHFKKSNFYSWRNKNSILMYVYNTKLINCGVIFDQWLKFLYHYCLRDDFMKLVLIVITLIDMFWNIML